MKVLEIVIALLLTSHRATAARAAPPPRHAVGGGSASRARRSIIAFAVGDRRRHADDADLAEPVRSRKGEAAKKSAASVAA